MSRGRGLFFFFFFSFFFFCSLEGSRSIRLWTMDGPLSPCGTEKGLRRHGCGRRREMVWENRRTERLAGVLGFQGRTLKLRSGGIVVILVGCASVEIWIPGLEGGDVISYWLNVLVSYSIFKVASSYTELVTRRWRYAFHFLRVVSSSRSAGSTANCPVPFSFSPPLVNR